jgi:membrane protein required for colicin V production
MNALDFIIGLVLVFVLIRGIFRGLVEEIASIIGVFAGIYGAVFYYPRGAAFLGRWMSDTGYANILSFIIIFGLIYFVISILGVLIRYVLNIASLGWLDRLCGALFGIIKGVLIVSVLVMALTAFLPGNTPLMRHSRLAPPVLLVSERLVKIVPKDMKERFGEKLKELRKGWKGLNPKA